MSDLKPQKGSPFTDILEHYRLIVLKTFTEATDESVTEASQAKTAANQAIKAAIAEAIGEDEAHSSADPLGYIAKQRNQLRQEIRQRLGIEENKNHE